MVGYSKIDIERPYCATLLTREKGPVKNGVDLGVNAPQPENVTIALKEIHH